MESDAFCPIFSTALAGAGLSFFSFWLCFLFLAFVGTYSRAGRLASAVIAGVLVTEAWGAAGCGVSSTYSRAGRSASALIAGAAATEAWGTAVEGGGKATGCGVSSTYSRAGRAASVVIAGALATEAWGTSSGTTSSTTI